MHNSSLKSKRGISIHFLFAAACRVCKQQIKSWADTRAPSKFQPMHGNRPMQAELSQQKLRVLEWKPSDGLSVARRRYFRPHPYRVEIWPGMNCACSASTTIYACTSESLHQVRWKRFLTCWTYSVDLCATRCQRCTFFKYFRTQIKNTSLQSLCILLTVGFYDTTVFSFFYSCMYFWIFFPLEFIFRVLLLLYPWTVVMRVHCSCSGHSRNDY